ncbi:50S ribosomal protein L15 [Acidaminobacter hydrogenoformans]|jgi:large subunit ribosomal protein L15|uniref:Large ribosomal subunit protein uL15 n=1 Tax=Acidaminobacter hydrogenoformans DSM 2784 TaxID=1120920 RepID=A0A1G5S6C4_9FIRM|nr:50S ribosomal protein L15 [Acidaminobacter hydrogenoformans]SCZ81904.1 LSU ribosomal protein L15P [Acidaminobacter hydrogenoformans DSM 2784]
MKLNELAPSQGTNKNRKRRGRGTATGQGKTGGRGMNGQNSRSGGGVRPGFEGGQLPLFRRIPKRGFKNRNRIDWTTVNIEVLNAFENGTVVTPELLIESGIVKKFSYGLKVLGDGSLNKEITVKAHKFTQSAIEKIEAAGGKAEVI